MAYTELKEQTLAANLALVEAGLVVLTWGNASIVDRQAGVMAIKPSGVAYEKLTADSIVVLSLEDGRVIDGSHRPSSDAPTHLHLAQEFRDIGAIVHTHSLYATSFAQAHREIPCFGTTHADNFYGTIPITRELHDAEIATDYELNSGRVIVECFRKNKIDPMAIPGVLLASHAPFAWGQSGAKAVENAIVMEFSARMAMNTLAMNWTRPLSPQLLAKHFLRKHGAAAYYGQK